MAIYAFVYALHVDALLAPRIGAQQFFSRTEISPPGGSGDHLQQYTRNAWLAP